jgi:hypothetical protein
MSAAAPDWRFRVCLSPASTAQPPSPFRKLSPFNHWLVPRGEFEKAPRRSDGPSPGTTRRGRMGTLGKRPDSFAVRQGTGGTRSRRCACHSHPRAPAPPAGRRCPSTREGRRTSHDWHPCESSGPPSGRGAPEAVALRKARCSGGRGAPEGAVLRRVTATHHPVTVGNAASGGCRGAVTDRGCHRTEPGPVCHQEGAKPPFATYRPIPVIRGQHIDDDSQQHFDIR